MEQRQLGGSGPEEAGWQAGADCLKLHPSAQLASGSRWMLSTSVRPAALLIRSAHNGTKWDTSNQQQQPRGFSRIDASGLSTEEGITGDVVACPTSCWGFRDLQRYGATLGTHRADNPLLKPERLIHGGWTNIPGKRHLMNALVFLARLLHVPDPFLQHMAEQPQVPQPLPISLVLQTLPQLHCPSLDTLQPLNVPLVVRGPTLNTAFEAAFQPLFPKPVALHWVAVAQVQDLALGLVKPHTIGPSASIQPVQVPLQSLPTLQQINTPTQLGVICKLTEGALDPLAQIIDKDIKQNWAQD
ncbi:hypothetical protein QYF61_004341 [Mycteria americana]|uniref:Uncharacterized protein n=1 Tax=Mycteria americana TaxID=33587 RepID=A0AAN7N8D9_MYCAM|nr:hypothetical protein QYF61_004341 [Mycteria americana]